MPPAPAPIPAATDMGTTPTVFIVDDDPGVRAGLSLLVYSCGWRPRPCASAEEFLASYARESPACLVLDLRMPGMSGADLQEVLAELDVAPPVIVLTAHQDHPMAERALAAGARTVIRKPFRDEILVREIERALREPQTSS